MRGTICTDDLAVAESSTGMVVRRGHRFAASASKIEESRGGQFLGKDPMNMLESGEEK
jgi:hypothetical protein